jgi:hypothetical protein
MEWPYQSGGSYVAPYPCYGMSAGALVSWLNSFSAQVRARIGRNPLIYTNTNWWNSCTANNTSFAAYPLTVANYSGSHGAMPAGWSTFTFWQYSDAGSVAGISGSVDMDAFNGTRAQLDTLVGSAAPGDFDGDGKTDEVLFQPSTGAWMVRNVGTVDASWGSSAYVPLVGDFNNDGVPDRALFQPSTGAWIVRNVGTVATWGGAGYVPLVADYNNDGKMDLILFQPSTGHWLVRNVGTVATWGGVGDVPLVGDFNGDGKTDLALFRPSTGQWYVRNVGLVDTWGSASYTAL